MSLWGGEAVLRPWGPDSLYLTKTKEWYHLALCDSAIALIDEMCKRYPDSPYIFPDIWYEQKKARYLEKEKNGGRDGLGRQANSFN